MLRDQVNPLLSHERMNRGQVILLRLPLAERRQHSRSGRSKPRSHKLLIDKSSSQCSRSSSIQHRFNILNVSSQRRSNSIRHRFNILSISSLLHNSSQRFNTRSNSSGRHL
jgi:hypothetical protein